MRSPEVGVLGLVLSSLLLALPDYASALTIPWETQSGYLQSGIYGWQYSYDIGFFDETLLVDVDIELAGEDPGPVLLNRWESGIESIWSTERFDIPIEFNVDWVAGDFDQYVTVTSGTGNWSMVDWYTVGAGGWGDDYQEAIVAHEFGHMISEWDEYAGGAVNPQTGLVDTGGLMATLSGPTLDYYYDPFLNWYALKSAVPEPTQNPAPEPATALLLAAGLAGSFAAWRLKRIRREKVLGTLD